MKTTHDAPQNGTPDGSPMLPGRRRKLRVTVGLSGGTGNQLFQYAAARSLAVRNRAELVLDHRSLFHGDLYRARFTLDAWRIQGTRIRRPPYLTKLGRGRRKIERALNRRVPLRWRRLIAA